MRAFAWAVLLVTAAAPVWAQRPAAPLPEGDWISVAYADALATTRSPLQAAEAGPLVLGVRRAGQVTRFTLTNFHELATFRVLTSELTERGGRIQIAPDEGEVDRGRARWVTLAWTDPPRRRDVRSSFTWDDTGDVTYRHLPKPVDEWVAELLIAGAYRDASGRSWRFDTDLHATTPDGRFPYVVALDPSEAGCSYFETPDPKQPGGKRRVGFAWKGQQLELFRILYDTEGPPIACAPAPYAVLTRVAPAADGGGSACRLSPLTVRPKAPGAFEYFVSTSSSFSLEHWNYGAAPAPDRFTEGPIKVTHRDGSTCALDAGSYTTALWVGSDGRTLVLISFSGSSQDLLFADTTTCVVRERLDVAGPTPKVGGSLVSFPGDCEMSDATWGTCLPASYWRLDAACHPVRLAADSAAWTRERFGLAFDDVSDIRAPFTPKATWLGPPSP